VSLASRGAGCLLGSGWVALVVLGSLALLALVLLGLLCHYRARHLAVRRVRSRLYSRLYSQDRYQRPVKRAEFWRALEPQPGETEAFAGEFEQLEKLAWDTIECSTSVAELPANRRRNRSANCTCIDQTFTPVFLLYTRQAYG